MIPHAALREALRAKRYQRWLTGRDLPRVPKGHCRWCGQPVPPPRRTWCCDECVQEYLIRSSNNNVAKQVYQRDKGVCAVCGMDCDWLRAECRRILRARGSRSVYESRVDWGPWDTWKSFWDADHIIPVSEGGGCCGLDNYRTLCVACHRRETVELARRLAYRRRVKAGCAMQMELQVRQMPWKFDV